NGAGPYNVSGVAGPYNINSISLAQSAGGISMFNGSIANFQIYNTALPPSAVQTLYAGGISGTPISNAGLVGWWPLNGNANDYSGNGNNGTATNVGYVGVVSRTYGQINSLSNYGLNLNGQNTDFVIANTPQIMTNSFTWSLWIYPKSWPGGNTGIFGQTSSAESGNGYAYIIEQGTPSSPEIQFSNSGGAASSVYAPISIDSLQNIVGTYNYTTGTIAIYVNGRPVQSATSTPLAIVSGPIYVGYSNRNLGAGITGYFNGTISNIQIYNTALSSLQVQQLYNSQLRSASSIIPMSWYP
ncbi:MAG: LamG domain-containing protein, partial [Candidatus Micrarchaeaceae archaeon]